MIHSLFDPHRRSWYRHRAAGLGILAACLVSTFSVAAHGQTPVKREQLLQQVIENPGDAKYALIDTGIEKFSERDFTAARKNFTDCYEANPDLPPPQVLMAQLFLVVKQAGLARGELEGAVLNTPKDPQAYIMFGQLALSQRWMTSARLQFLHGEQLCKQYTANPKRKTLLLKGAYNGLAQVAETSATLAAKAKPQATWGKLAAAQWNVAQKYLNEIVKLDSQNANTRRRLGLVLFHKGGEANQKAAYAQLIESSKIDPKLPRAEVTMAMLYEQIDDRKMAERLMKMAVEAKRGGTDLNTRLQAAKWATEASTSSSSERAKLLAFATANVAAARKLGGTATSKQKLNIELMAGSVARHSGAWTTAEAAYDEARLIDPTNFQALNGVVLSLLEQGSDSTKTVRAEGQAKVNANTFGDLKQLSGREARGTLAWAMFLAGRETDAQRMMGEVIQTGGQVSAETAYYAAKIFQAGNPAVALRILKPTLDDKRSFPKRAKAEQLLKDLLAAQPKS